jgi:hypothetical protein
MDNFDFEKLRQAFTYFPKTGVLIRNSNGKSMSGLDAYGYIQLGYLKKMYKAHRIIWAIVHGEFPKGHIDHINGERADNRIDNLRVVTHQQNVHNQQKKNKRNKSGYVGVCWNKRSAKWQATIHANGASIYLGVFHSAEKAHEAYLSAKLIYHTSAPDRLFFV